LETQTEFPNAEPELRTILDAWHAIAIDYTRNPDLDIRYTGVMRRQLYSAGRDLMAEFRSLRIPEADWPVCMWWVYHEMDKRKLSMVLPRSLRWGVKEWLRKRGEKPIEARSERDWLGEAYEPNAAS
jgi:Iap family predicted aminopeptidase